MLKAALIGFGNIAKAHRKGYANLEKSGKVQLICACDIRPEAIKENSAPLCEALKEHLRFYTDLDEMLRTEEFDFADICVPSFLHRGITEKLLRSGHPVLCEKPMALCSEDAQEMLRAANESGKELMIAQCVRFMPGFDYIKEAIEDNRFGKVIGGFFSRISPPPTWGWENWFMNPRRSGGCITDLHIHDIDIIRYLFGEPDAVSCRASSSVCVYDIVHTSLFYGETPITAIGDWSLSGIRFESSARVNFEKATVVYDQSELTVYPKDGSSAYTVPLPSVSMYEAEISYFCDVLTKAAKNTKNPAFSAARSLRLIERMKESADNAGRIIHLRGK